ncbi:MAG: hypothetical protein ACRED8_06465, partial [Caulobacteraceae bacterium]
MTFAKRLREKVISGEITQSVRVWHRPRVRVGGRYPQEQGEIEVTGIREIGFEGITPKLAGDTGFVGVVDLLKIARHGS